MEFIFKGYDTLEFQADIPPTVTCIPLAMELQHDWNLWCTQKLSFKMKLKQLSCYLIINNTPGCPVLHTGNIYIFITKALHSWNAFYICTCTDPGQSTVLFWQNSQIIVYFKWLSTFNTGITDLMKKTISDSNIKHMEAVPTVVHINYSICYM